MAKSQEAWTALITQLESGIKAGETLSYVKGVYEGAREAITKFPVLIIEPISEREAEQVIAGYTDVIMEVSVVGLIKVLAKDKQIVGSGSVKGIMDLKNDLCSVLSTDPTLGASVTDIKINPADYNNQNYPIRTVAVNVEIMFRQKTKTRI